MTEQPADFGHQSTPAQRDREAAALTRQPASRQRKASR